MERDAAIAQLEALVLAPGTLRIITNEHACGGGVHPDIGGPADEAGVRAPFDADACAAFAHPLTQISWLTTSAEPSVGTTKCAEVAEVGRVAVAFSAVGPVHCVRSAPGISTSASSAVKPARSCGAAVSPTCDSASNWLLGSIVSCAAFSVCALTPVMSVGRSERHSGEPPSVP